MRSLEIMARVVQTKDTVVTSERVILFTTIQVRDIPLTLIEECSDKKRADSPSASTGVIHDGLLTHQ
jgi:hypothetical protein